MRTLLPHHPTTPPPMPCHAAVTLIAQAFTPTILLPWLLQCPSIDPHTPDIQTCNAYTHFFFASTLAAKQYSDTPPFSTSQLVLFATPLARFTWIVITFKQSGGAI
jgi:hypothetical protein